MNKIYFFTLILFGSCATHTSEKHDAFVAHEVKYAKGFHFEESKNKKYLVIDEPWPGSKTPVRYELGEKLKKIVCTSTSHLPFFELLHAEEFVIGFPNLNYISSEVFIQRGKEGLLTDLGTDGSINMELLLSIDPDAVIAFDMGGESQALNKIQEVGIPIYYNSDFLEQSPLGRVEWIKFFGALLAKEAMADSIFRVIEKNYLRLKDLVATVENRPTILSGIVYGDTWFLPGGNNWAATFFNTAGGSYVWDSDTTSGWLELDFEAVYNKGYNADKWIGTSSFNTRNEMLGQENRYNSFVSFQKEEVYNYNKKIGPNGGFDFFESGYSRPDIILSDLIKILHPDLLPNYETVYFQKLP